MNPYVDMAKQNFRELVQLIEFNSLANAQLTYALEALSYASETNLEEALDILTVYLHHPKLFVVEGVLIAFNNLEPKWMCRAVEEIETFLKQQAQQCRLKTPHRIMLTQALKHYKLTLQGQ